MTREYQAKKSKPQPKKRSALVLPVFVAFLVGYITASFISIESVGEWIEKSAISNRVNTKSQDTHANKTLPKPKFEFYSALTGERVRIQNHKAPVKNATSLVEKGVKENPAQQAVSEQNKTLFMLQMASFKMRSDAESLKASLLLKGYDVTISTATAQESTWYRVNIGPFSNQLQAEKVRTTIARSDHIMGMVRKLEG